MDGKKKRPAPKRSSRWLSTRLRVLGRSEFKRQTFYALENIRHGNIIAKSVGVALFILIVANALVVCITVQADTDVLSYHFLKWFYFFSTLCFLLEYIARIWIADLAFGNCTPIQARLKYIFSPLGIVDFLSFAPSMLSWFVPVTPMLIHAIGIIRLIRLVKITRYMRGFRTIGRVMSKHYHEIAAAFLVILLLIVVASVIMYELENPAQPQNFDNLLSGFWWAVQTVTSTGYGDIVPITPGGRIVGSIIMLLSLALVAIPGGIFSAGFVAEFQKANLRRIERDVKRESKEFKSSDDASDDDEDESEEDSGDADSRDEGSYDESSRITGD